MQHLFTTTAARTHAVYTLATVFVVLPQLRSPTHGMQLITQPSQPQSVMHTPAMDRPRNRQPRADNDRRRGDEHKSHPSRSPYPHSVPGVGQVKPGSKVSIVLKQDQTSGREVQGIVQDVLTSGNHPRGIKVRMTDQRVGRVQRMVTQSSGLEISAQGTAAGSELNRPPHDQIGLQQPPPRPLADFIKIKPTATRQRAAGVRQMSTTAICPICNQFEGDEIAVSRHVEMCNH